MSAPCNPPAFPNDPRVQLGDDYQGMTLRDYFAGQVAPSLMSGLMPVIPAEHRDEIANLVAQGAYEFADAMLAERAKEQQAQPIMRHVAYYDEGQFHWMTGHAPRDCKLFAEVQA